VAVIVAGLCLAAGTPRPDVLIAPGGEVVAVRVAGGKLAIMKLGSNGFAAREWLAADADARSPGDPTLGEGFACDENGCIARLADGTPIAVALRPQAFEEDCASAAIIVSRRAAPPHCEAVVIDRDVWPGTGALSFVRRGDGWTISAAHPRGYDRPWAPASHAEASGPAPSRRAPDAAPNPSDLRADD
jgi:competence protein ComEC